MMNDRAFWRTTHGGKTLVEGKSSKGGKNKPPSTPRPDGQPFQLTMDGNFIDDGKGGKQLIPNYRNGPCYVLRSEMRMRELALVKFNFDVVPKEWHKSYKKFRNKVLIYFGEIPNMPGHGIFMDRKTGKFYTGYHIENFIELSEDET